MRIQYYILKKDIPERENEKGTYGLFLPYYCLSLLPFIIWPIIIIIIIITRLV